MNDRVERAAALASRLDPTWDAVRVEASLARLHGKARRRRGATAAAAAVAAVAIAVALWPQRPAAPLVAAPVATAPAPVLLRDGTRVIPGAEASLSLLEDTPLRTTFELGAGAAHFEVVHSNRTFTVVVGPVTVTDLGTVFDVEREPGRVRVAVTNGKVQVAAPAEQLELSAGEAKWFALLPSAPSVPATPIAAAEPRAPAAAVAAPAKHPSPPREPARPAAVDWRALANEGRFGEAYAQLSAPGAVGDQVEDLMLAADAARLSGHPGDATGFLRRVVSAHRSEPQAPLASFTLGKLLLESGQAREAAEAFAGTRALAPAGALAEDALAREVEALAKAGDREQARVRATEYLRVYPAGARAESVRTLGGLPP